MSFESVKNNQLQVKVPSIKLALFIHRKTFWQSIAFVIETESI
jgi:hypothetical protein